MTPARRQRIVQVFTEASALAPSARAAFLDSACEDADLRAEVEKLFAENATAPNLSRGAAEADLTGRTLGPYTILKLIGRGGMGAIYLASDSRLDRQVALKVLPLAGFGNRESMQRFQREARAASALNHPNIITIFDFGQSEDIYYIATELVEGRTLRDIIRDEKTPLRDAVAIATQIASALSAAHAAGIVHRDIKPENIMVRRDGYVKVLDFGLAKLRGGSGEKKPEAPTTNPGAVIGTVRYMSPEQARGQELDARTDLFSLGAALYELATRQTPFPGASHADVIAAVIGHEPAPFARSASALLPLEPVVRKCLRKDRDHRYQTASDLLADLRQLQADLQTTTGISAAPQQASRRRLPVPIAALLAALLVAGAGAGAWFWFHSRATAWYQNSRITRIPGSSDFSSGVLSSDGRYLAYVSTLADGNRSLNFRLMSAAKAIELVPPAAVAFNALAFSADGSFLYYTVRVTKPGELSTLYRIPVLGGHPQKIADDVSGKIAVSPDGSSIALVRRTQNDGRLSIISTDGANERELLRRRIDFPFYALAWSADSREIYFSEAKQASADGDCHIFVVSREGGEPRQAAHPDRTFVYDLFPLPDGSGFLANAFDTEAGLRQIWHISFDGSMRHITHDLSNYQNLSASADGRQILTSPTERSSELWIVAFDGHTAPRRLTEQGRRYDSPSWVRDGSIVASRYEAGKWMLWSVSPDGAQHPLFPESAADISPHACPDRDDIVFASARKGPYTIWRVLPDGTGLKQISKGPNDRYPECVAGGTVLYWLQIGNERTAMQVPLEGGAATPSAPLTAHQVVSPDGRLVLAPLTDDKAHEHLLAVRTRDMQTTLATYPFGGRSAALAWSRDSKGFVDVRPTGAGREIWYQPIAGGPARQLTQFGDQTLYDVSWSPDGRQLLCSRVRFLADLVLIQDVP
jgi:serine/threonine protein kinase/Tol biopolymer transport system component